MKSLKQRVRELLNEWDPMHTIDEDERESDIEYDGYIKGIMRSGVIVAKECELACISDEVDEDIKELPAVSISISGGVLEAILYDINLNE